MKRVYIWIDKFDVGGVQTSLFNILSRMHADNLSFHIVMVNKLTDFFDNELAQIEYTLLIDERIDNPIIRFKLGISRFKQFIKQNDVETVYFAINHTVDFLYVLAAENSGVRTRITRCECAGLANKWKVLANNVFKLFFQKTATKRLAVSKRAAQWVYGKKYLNQVTILPNGIDFSQFLSDKREREEMRKQMGIDDLFVVLHIGKFEKVKNHEKLLDIFYEIKKLEQKSVLLLVGDGSSKRREAIQNKIRRLHLETSVIVCGNTKDIKKMMMVSDCMVLPSLYEGFGMTLIEAQAMHLKAYASDAVPCEVKFSDYLHFLPLQLKSGKWAQEILSNMDTDVDVDAEKAAIFDIEYVAEMFENILRNEINKSGSTSR